MKMASDMKPATLTTLVFMCILPLTVNQAASEAMAASKHPQRSQMASESISVTSITHVTMLIWLQMASI